MLVVEASDQRVEFWDTPGEPAAVVAVVDSPVVELVAEGLLVQPVDLVHCALPGAQAAGPAGEGATGSDRADDQVERFVDLRDELGAPGQRRCSAAVLRDQVELAEPGAQRVMHLGVALAAVARAIQCSAAACRPRPRPRARR